MSKLVEMITIAERIPYIPPTNSNVDEWTNEEMCNTYPPLKLIGKNILRKYIKHFTDLYNQSK